MKCVLFPYTLILGLDKNVQTRHVYPSYTYLLLIKKVNRFLLKKEELDTAAYSDIYFRKNHYLFKQSQINRIHDLKHTYT